MPLVGPEREHVVTTVNAAITALDRRDRKAA
jgi:4-hydroxy-tetrahydrodipicolinate synthase